MNVYAEIHQNLDELDAAIDARLADIAFLKLRIARLEAAMKQVVNELEEDFDTVDGGDGQPAPNKSMRLAHELEEAMYVSGGF